MGEVSKGEGRTVLFVSHNMGSIMQLCNNALLLTNGQLDSASLTSEIINKYLLQNDATENFNFNKLEIHKFSRLYFK